MRVRRRKRRLIVTIASVLVIVVAAAAVCYVSYLPRYTIQSITVEGANAVPADLIENYADSIIYDGSHHLLSRANIFLFPQALIEKDIPLEFPRIQSATISRDSLFSNAITITVTERQTAAVWCDGAGNCYDMDKNGFIFSQISSSATSSGAYIFQGGFSLQHTAATSTTDVASSSVATSSPALQAAAVQPNPTGNPVGQTFAPGHLPGLLVFLQLLGQAGYAPTGATVESDEDFIVPLEAGYSIYASFGEDAETLVNNLQLVLSSSALSGQTQDLEYVDLRFGDRVYYKLKGQDQAQTSAQ